MPHLAPTLLAASLAIPIAIPTAHAQDFDGDGKSDLAVGAPHETVGDWKRCGTVSVRYGDYDKQNLVQPPSAWNSGPEQGAEFGTALAWGDFDGDGFDDLAVGASHASVSGYASAGVVTVFYGSKYGLGTSKEHVLCQDTFGVADVAEAGDGLGWSLETGDFDGDGVADLAVGAPFEDSPKADNSGIVHVLFGQVVAGLTGDGALAFEQGVGGLLETRETWDFFGWTLATGDFRADGYDDLAVGVPHEDVGKAVDAGAVQIIPFYGGKTDLGHQQVWTQDSPGIHDEPEYVDNFGWSLAAGDFVFPGISEGYDACDLAIGVPGEDPDGVPDAGAVHVLFGFEGKGLVHDFTWLFHQGMNAAWKEKPEQGDGFGYSLAAPLRWDGTCSLAIGVPFEDLPGAPDAGVVHVLTRKILVMWFNIFELASLTLDQDDLLGSEESPEAGDRFGYVIARSGIPYGGDHIGSLYNDNGRLAISAPFEDQGKQADVGQVAESQIYGKSWVGLSFWQDQLDPVEVPEPGDRLGFGL